jgi:PAS domain S-box-containing protein
LVFLLLALSMALVGTALTTQMVLNAQDTATDNYAQLSAEEAADIQTWLDRHESYVRQINDTTSLGTASNAAIQAYLNESLSRAGVPESAIALHYIDTDSERIVASTDAEIRGERFVSVYRPWAQALRIDGQVRTEGPYVVDNTTRVYVAVPDAQETNRTLVMTASTETLRGELGPPAPANESSYTVVVSNRGTVVFDERDRVAGQTYMESGADSRLLSSAREGSAAGGLVTDENPRITAALDATRYVAAYARVPSQDWVVVTHVPARVAFGFATEIQRFGLGLTAVGVVAIALVGSLFGRRLADAIDDLAAKAEQMQAGDLDVDFSTARVDEIGRLAEVFDETQRELRDQIVESTLTENASDLITVVDEDGTITYQSPSIQQILGRDAERVCGEPFVNLVHPDDVEPVETTLQDVTRDPADEPRREYRMVRADGETRLFDSAFENLLQTPFIEGIVITSRDVTERKERERRLEAQNERLEKFASIVSHDLRNPLNVTNGRLDLLASEIESEHIEPIERSLNRMGRLIDDLLTLARSGQTVQEPDPVPLAVIAEEAWQNVQAIDSELVIDVDSTVTIPADHDRLLHVFENLYRNATDHNDCPVTITVSVTDEAPVHDRPAAGGFYVADDGQGVPPSKEEAIFEHGYTESEDGSGLGLAIVEDIVDAHGWDIEVTDGPAGGAKFVISGMEMMR